MITKLIYLLTRRLFQHHENEMMKRHENSMRKTAYSVMREYHDTHGRDALNKAIEGAVGECKDHAAASVQALRVEVAGAEAVEIVEIPKVEVIEPLVFGHEAGEVCNRDGCTGEMVHLLVENCACHIHPPCSACVDNPLVCFTCGFNPEEDVLEIDGAPVEMDVPAVPQMPGGNEGARDYCAMGCDQYGEPDKQGRHWCVVCGAPAPF